MPRATDGRNLRKQNIIRESSRRLRAAKNPPDKTGLDRAAEKVQAPTKRTQEQLPNAHFGVAGFSQEHNTTHLVIRGRRFFGRKNGWCLFESYHQEYTSGANAPNNGGGQGLPLAARQGFESLVDPHEFKNHVWYATLWETFKGTLHAVAHPTIQSLRLIAIHVSTWWHAISK